MLISLVTTAGHHTYLKAVGFRCNTNFSVMCETSFALYNYKSDKGRNPNWSTGLGFWSNLFINTVNLLVPSKMNE